MGVLRVNVADRLQRCAAEMPGDAAVARATRRGYATCTFGELDADAAALARGLVDLGVRPGMRMVLLVRPGIEFVKLVFALLRSGATTVLVDPGMGRKHLVNCLTAAEPEGFAAISAGQAVRALCRRRFPRARLNVTVGRRWFWGGLTYRQLLERGLRSRTTLPETQADDAAAIIFTSGSTGPPKGVLYTHLMFDTQASEIQRAYDLQPGGVDLACFALFGLFNSAMGVTTVFPEMDFSRPAAADPRKLLAAANDWKVTQAFASPTVWDRLSRYCAATGKNVPTLRKIFSCGAPVSPAVLKHTLAMAHSEAEMHTPYGATEALPVSTIEAREVLDETAARTREGAGVCVGRRFDSIEWRVIRIGDETIGSVEEAEELPAGEIGELVVRGPQVSPSYLDHPAPSPLRGGLGRRTEAGTRGDHPSLTLPVEGRGPEGNPRAEPGAVAANALSKIRDGDAVWHRMGDVGYLDERGRFWYCGRKSQRVETRAGVLFTEVVEAQFNKHPAVYRSALIGIGERGDEIPLICLQMSRRSGNDWNRDPVSDVTRLVDGATLAIMPSAAVFFPEFPMDVRHNAKIVRELLRDWACEMILLEPQLYTDGIVDRAESHKRGALPSPQFAGGGPA